MAVEDTPTEIAPTPTPPLPLPLLPPVLALYGRVRDEARDDEDEDDEDCCRACPLN